MRRAFVTGAHGVVGRWLVEGLLERGAQVVVLRRSPGRPSALVLDRVEERCRVVPGDLADAERLRGQLAGCDAVFHLAAQAVVGAAPHALLATLETNVRGTWNLLEAAHAAGVERVVVASTDRVYGHRETAPAEDAPLAATGPYDVSKACADQVARTYHRSTGLPVAVARTSNVYGPGDLERTRLVPGVAGSLMAGRRPVVHSDGSPSRDLLAGPDAAAAYLAIADALPGSAGEAFNVGRGELHTVRAVVDLLRELTGSALEADYQGTGGEEGTRAVDAAKLHGRTGWRPRIELREGLEHALAWYAGHPGALGAR